MKSFKDLVNETKKWTERVEFEVPAEFEEDASHFIGAASRAHKKGKKEFKLGGKTYPVTIKKPVTEETVWNKAAKEDVDPKDKGEYDYEGEMAKDYLETAKRGIEALMGMIKDDQNLPEWVQSKIVKASDYIDTVADYMMSQGDEQIDEVKNPHAVIQKKLSDIQQKRDRKPMTDAQWEAEKQKKIRERDAWIRAERAAGRQPLMKLSTEEKINEVLTADDPMEKWIDDFQKSDNPKFDGKSKEKRKEMAIAAKLQADREAGKEVPPKKECKTFKEYLEGYVHKGTYGTSYKAHDDKYDDYEDKKSYAKRIGISPVVTRKKPVAKTTSSNRGRGRPVGSTSGAQSRVRKI